MEKKGSGTVFAAIMAIFYSAIVMFVFFGVLKLHNTGNFIPALVFQCVNFLILFLAIVRMGTVQCDESHHVSGLHYLPAVLVTICYSLIAAGINLALSAVLINTVFILIHLLLLFIYLLISIPIYMMGRR